jgi:hypothetical protein
MENEGSTNPRLTDLFKTAITIAKTTDTPEAPANIVVHGSNNVVSWGGTVYMATHRQAGEATS